MKSAEHLVVLLPENDPESLMLGEICLAFQIPSVISRQPHGAYLGAEECLEERIREVNPNAQEIIIIEIPGPNEEKELEKKGLQITIIDHHRYEGLDRMHPKSSLEQFLVYMDIQERDLQEKGFSPMLVKGVAIIDRSFVWGLKAEGYSDTQKQEAIAYYQSFLHKMYGAERKRQEDLAAALYQKRKQQGGFLIIQNTNPNMNVRDALSFEIAKHHTAPIATIIHSRDMIYVQESDRALELYKKFGGFMYGGEERCWGKQFEGENEREKIEETLGVEL